MPVRPATLNDVDLALLRMLRDDGRASVTTLAAGAHISRANAYARLDRLRRDGTIRGYSAVVNPGPLGLNITAIVLLSTGSTGRFRWRELRERLNQMPAVEYAALVTGDADILALVRVANQEKLRRLLLEELQGLPHVTSTFTLMVLDEVVRRPYVLPDNGSESA